jgi:hypothetical protein
MDISHLVFSCMRSLLLKRIGIHIVQYTHSHSKIYTLLAEGTVAAGGNVRPSTPIPGPSSKSNACPGPGPSLSSCAHVRPPSPVLPRKKSGGSGPALRNAPTSTAALSGKNFESFFLSNHSKSEQMIYIQCCYPATAWLKSPSKQQTSFHKSNICKYIYLYSEF